MDSWKYFVMKNRKCLTQLTIVVGLCAIIVTRGQFAIPHASILGQDAANTRRARIVEIMQRTLKSGEGRIVRNGQVYNIYTRRGPSSEDLEEVRGYGEDAVPILAEYVASENAPEYELAMMFLGAIGGGAIVPPLEAVILQNPSARKREYAVRTITQGPRDEALEILRRAAANDVDAKVRKVAKEMLKGMRS